MYPDGAPSAFFSTADMDSIADVASTGYANLERIYENYFPQSADESIDKWVVKAFGYLFDDSITLQQKRDAIIAKLRKQPTITLWEIAKIVASYVPEGTFIQIAEYNCGAAESWKLDQSLLDASTYLGFNGRLVDLGVEATNWCEFVQNLAWKLDVNALDVDTTLSEQSWQDVSEVQAEAFQYEIRIFGYEITGSNLVNMLKEVKAQEPARSGATLKQNLVLSDYGLNTTVNEVDQFSGVDCITRDPLQTTGYSGRTI